MNYINHKQNEIQLFPQLYEFIFLCLENYYQFL